MKPVLLGIWAAISIAILLFAYQHPIGATTPDSANYLRLANTLLEKQTFFVHDLLAQNKRAFFSVWPVGYPLMIAGTAAAFGIDSWLASKLLSLFYLALLFAIFYRLYGRNAHYFAALFMLDFVMAVYAQTWAETMHITCLIILAIGLARYHAQKPAALMLVLAAAAAAFSARYIGAVNLLPIGLLAVYEMRKHQRTQAFRLIGVCALLAAMMAGYLWMNHHFSGYITGIERVRHNNDILTLFVRLVVLQLWQLRFVILALILLLGYQRIKPLQHMPKQPLTGLAYWPFFLMIGLSHTLAMVSLRFVFLFDEFGNRLLAPGSILMLLAAMDYLRHYPLFFIRAGRALIFVGGLSLVYLGGYKAFLKDDHPTYKQQQAYFHKHYRNVPAGSVILYGDKATLYLRKGLQPAAAYPYYGEALYHTQHPLNKAQFKKRSASVKAKAKKLCRYPHVKAVYFDLAGLQRRSRLAKFPTYPAHEPVKLIRRCQ